MNRAARILELARAKIAAEQGFKSMQEPVRKTSKNSLKWSCPRVKRWLDFQCEPVKKCTRTASTTDINGSPAATWTNGNGWDLTTSTAAASSMLIVATTVIVPSSSSVETLTSIGAAIADVPADVSESSKVQGTEREAFHIALLSRYQMMRQ